MTMTGLAHLYARQGRSAEAEALLLETLETQQSTLGGAHADTLWSVNFLATLYEDEGRYSEAEPLYLQALEGRERLSGEEHPETLGVMTNLGLLYNRMERFGEAAAMFERSLPIKRRVLGVRHPWTGIAMNGLAKAYMALGRRDEAIALYRELLELSLDLAEAADADASTLNSAAWTLLTHEIDELRDPARALGLAERACTMEEGSGGGSLWSYLDTLALAQHRTGDSATAATTQRRALSLMSAEQPERAECEQRLAEYEAALESAERHAGNTDDR